MKKLPQDILEKLDADEKRRYALFHNAVNATMVDYNEEPTVASKKNLESADLALEEIIGILSEKYGEKQPEAGGSSRLKTKKSVYEYLLDCGWQIGRSQFYEHCKAMLLRPEKTGGFLKKKVDAYAKRNLRQKETGQKIDEFQAEKNNIDLETSRVKLEKEQYELGVKKGRYIPRDQHELAVVGRVVAFQAHLNHTIQTSIEDWIDIVGGDHAKAADLVEAISQAIEQRLGDFAADAEFDIILEADA